MLRFRVVMIALVALLAIASVSDAAKPEKKKGQGVAGTVKSIDTATKSITITVKSKKETGDKTFTVADDVKVTLNGEPKAFGDLEAGAKVRLKLSEDGKTITAISVGKKKKN